MKRAIVLAVIALARAAHGEHETLRDVLGEAPVIVRGSAIETRRTDTEFAVSDTLRGDASETIIVRDVAEGAAPLDRGEDVILLLDAKTADGVYPLHHPVGRYRVDGEDVIVNASGVDPANVSGKDLRPRAPDERLPLEQFRALAGGAPRGSAAPATLDPPPPRTPTRGSGAPAPAQAPERSGAPRWPWLVAALAALALVLYGVRRAR